MSEPEKSSQTSRPDRGAYGIAAGLAALAGIVAWDAAHISTAVVSYSRIGADVFPYAVAALLGIAAVATVFAAARGDFPDREPLELGPVGWIVGGLVAQIILIGFAGFSIATGVLFAFTARGFGGKPLWLTIPIGVALSFFLYVVFSKGLQLGLPAGPLERLI